MKEVAEAKRNLEAAQQAKAAARTAYDEQPWDKGLLADLEKAAKAVDKAESVLADVQKKHDADCRKRLDKQNARRRELRERRVELVSAYITAADATADVVVQLHELFDAAREARAERNAILREQGKPAELDPTADDADRGVLYIEIGNAMDAASKRLTDEDPVRAWLLRALKPTVDTFRAPWGRQPKNQPKAAE